MKAALLYVASAVLILWGIAHIVMPTRSIINGFGPISSDNRRILLMEWLMEGILLIFIGVLVTLMTFVATEQSAEALLVYRLSGLTLLVMAAISFFTGARTSILPMKLCPPIFAGTALLLFAASYD